MSAEVWPVLSRITGQERAVRLLSRMLAARQGTGLSLLRPGGGEKR
ncbi:MAG: hypothetical protein JRC92_10805 [Deltaproteobacteria bacterium]|nr:hypothetical protein [Deltaproteobacteria bacterium]